MRKKCVRAAWSFALCLSVALAACDDENNENDGPVVPPPVDESIDLTASEAYANCFIVTEADEYRFATRKVDGSDVEGIVSVDWLWSTKNAAGNPLVSRGLQRRYRAFPTSDGTDGRTVFGGFDRRSVIRSWHLWMTGCQIVRLRRGRRIDGSQSRSDRAVEVGRGRPFRPIFVGDAKIPFTAAKRTKIRATASSCGHGNRRSSIRLMHRWHGSP